MSTDINESLTRTMVLRAVGPEGGRRRTGVTFLRERGGTVAGLGLVFGVSAVSLAVRHGVGTICGLLFLLAGIVIVVRFLLARQWQQYLEFTLWMWLLDPFVRRVVDYASVFHRLSPVVITAPFVSLLGILATRAFRTPVYRDTMAAIGVASAVLVYGLVSGAVQVGPAAAADAGINVLGPLALGIFVLTAPITTSRFEATFTRLSVIGCLGLGAYGTLQFLVLPPWDRDWVENSGINAVGVAEAGSIRVFGTMASPGPYALTLVALIVMALAAGRTRSRSHPYVRFAGIVVAVIALGLSLIRSGWIGLLVAVVLLVATRKLSGIRLAAGAVLLLVGVVLFGGPIADKISARFDDSASAGSTDYSLGKRIEFQSTIFGDTVTDVVGEGLGATGTASRLAGNSDPSLVRSFDSGILEPMYTLGSLPGFVLLLTTVTTAVSGFRRSRRLPDYATFIAVLPIVMVVTMLITNVYLGAYAVMMWLGIGFSGRQRYDIDPLPGPFLPPARRRR